ncbi:MAG: hypothetical protein R6U27_06525, partial [Desulfobacterales bacterium]
QNLQIGSGDQQILKVKGNQTPSVPVYSGVGGIRYFWQDLSFSARLRHVGKMLKSILFQGDEEERIKVKDGAEKLKAK